MQNAKIKFAKKNYLKLLGEKLPMACDLLQCFKVNHSELSKTFIDYETMYIEDGVKYFSLPRTELIFILLGVDRKCITTVRRYTPERWAFYKRNEGKEVDLVWE